MTYQCRQCSFTNGEVGACPVCNIPMDIKLQDENTEENNDGMQQPDRPAAEPATDAPVTDMPAAPAPSEDQEGGDASAEGGDEAVA